MQKSMFRKGLVLGIIVLFIGFTINVSADDTTDDLLDQYQLEDNTYLYLWGPWWKAQSFKPSLDTLTRIEILGSSNNLNVPLEISIRQNLAGTDLSYISIPSNELPTTKTWIDINLPDIQVTPETTYYIVLRNAGDINHAFRWAAIHDILDHYPRGTAYWSNNCGQDWIPFDEPDEYYDACFKTYGIDTLPPDAPIIDGPTSGKPGVEYDYTFNATDPEGDPVMYFVDWGDNNTEWTEYSDSGEEFMLKHTWNEEGEYTIKAKAKDTSGAESEWGTLTVSMPRNKPVYFSLLSWLFERFPNAFTILRYILELQ